MRIVIAGGPHTGKTSLVESLASDGFSIIHEASTNVILDEQSKGNLEPWKNRKALQKRISELQILHFNQVNNEDIVIFDRGIPDGIAYYQLDNIEPPKELIDAAKTYKYDIVFIVEMLDYYVPGGTRGETSEQREHAHMLIKQAYANAGYNVISIPKGSVEDRVSFVKNIISKF